MSALSHNIAAGLAKIGLALKTHAWQQAGGAGLTPTQSQILATLAGRGSRMRLADVAEALAVTPATTSDAVSALVRKGLLRKQRDADDSRALAIVLTARGRRVAARVSEWPDFLLAAVDSLSETEQTVFVGALVKMVRSLQEQGRIPIARMCVNCRFFAPHRYPDPVNPHHCGFVDAPFGPRDLRLDCPDFEPALVSIQNASANAISKL